MLTWGPYPDPLPGDMSEGRDKGRANKGGSLGYSDFFTSQAAPPDTLNWLPSLPIHLLLS